MAGPAPSVTGAQVDCRAVPNPSHEALLGELDAILPAATALYGYGDEDVWCIKEAVRADRAGAPHELRLLVRQWRIDVVAAKLDREELIGDAAQRARMQFRIDVMGTSRDENGKPYGDEQRELLVAGFGPPLVAARTAQSGPAVSPDKPGAPPPVKRRC